jgi:hypothetical protein
MQRALDIGFSLDELKAILGVRDRGGRPCRHVRNMLHPDNQYPSAKQTISQCKRRFFRIAPIAAHHIGAACGQFT